MSIHQNKMIFPFSLLKLPFLASYFSPKLFRINLKIVSKKKKQENTHKQNYPLYGKLIKLNFELFRRTLQRINFADYTWNARIKNAFVSFEFIFTFFSTIIRFYCKRNLESSNLLINFYYTEFVSEIFQGL